MNVGLIGTGYWGKVYIKTLQNIPNVSLSTCTRDYQKMISRPDIDCVIIATPAETHFQIIKDCLIAGKHVLVEKPFITNSDDAAELCYALDVSSEKLVAMVGHIYLHHSGITMLKELINSGVLGEINHVYSHRMSCSKHPNALWEMGAHDVYILEYLFDKYVDEEVHAMGNISHCIFHKRYKKILYEPYTREHIVNAYVEVSNYCYQGNKIREIIIEGSKKRAVFDDEAKIKLHTVDNQTKVVNVIEIDETVSPLEKQCRHFFHCVMSDQFTPISGIFEGFKNIRSLEFINKLL
jgi:UDP-2-acetamido-3-amino-2,3-dideoxy-glucuronate N-acetyltransferase